MKFVWLRFLVVVAFLFAGLPTFAQELNWSLDQYDPNTTNVTGQANGQPGVASAVFNNKIWIAYLASDTCNGNLCDIELGNNNGGGLNFTYKSYITISGVRITSNANPAMTVMGNTLYLAYTDANNNNWVIHSTDGQNWTGPFQVAVGSSTWYSPSIATDPSGMYLYLAYMSGTTKTPIVCTAYVANWSTTCVNETSLNTINYNPVLTSWNGLLYIGYPASSGSCLSFYTYSGGFTIWNPWAPTECAEQTNASPSLAVYNGNLFIASRANNNGKDFIATTVTNNGNGIWGVYEDQLSFGMGGPGNLLPVTISQSGSPAPPYLVNFYTYQNRLYYTYGK